MRADRMMPLETLLVAITLVKQLNYNGFKNSAGLGLEPHVRKWAESCEKWGGYL